MCAIFGFLEKKETANREIAEKMVKILKHRGPDDWGIEKFSVENGVNGYIGFNRLSIRDLSLNGHQPMFSQDRNVILTFNGEIYNADEYRDILIERGYNFKSTTDTEVILFLYLEYGMPEMLKYLNGMFAICILDKSLNKIFLVRDRVGEKPIFYYTSDDLFLYASEQKAFYMHDKFNPELNYDVLDEYLAFSYIAGNRTLLKNVYMVKPGCYLEYDFYGGIDEYQYWSLDEFCYQNTDNSIQQFKDKLISSVNSRLVSDVPVGVELSGGIDSSMITWISSNVIQSLNTYSIIFDDDDVNEETYIDYVANKCKTNQNKIKFEIDDFLQEIENCTWYFDAPIHHQGSIALYFLCKKINRRTPVVLTGEGADELLGGYEWYAKSFFQNNNKIFTFLRRLYHKMNGRYGVNWYDIKGLSKEEYYMMETSYLKPDILLKLRPDLSINNILSERKRIFNSIRQKGIIKKLDYEMMTYMVDLLVRQDKMSMASSIECRVPFVDQELIQYTRENIHIDNLIDKKGNPIKRTKIILKKISQEVFGNEFTYRKKMGLPLPLKNFFEHSNFDYYFKTVLLPGIKKRNIIDANFVEAMWNDKNKKNVKALWIIINFEIWAEIFLDNSGERVRTFNNGTVK